MPPKNSRWEESRAGESTRRESPETFEGLLVSIGGNRLAMTKFIGHDTVHTLAIDAKLTCDGNECDSDQLQTGTWIRVTTKREDPRVATCIEVI